MFSKDAWLSHEDYVQSLFEADRKHREEHNGQPIYKDFFEAELFLKMLYLDLDPLKEIVMDEYSLGNGRPPIPPDRIIRSDYLRVATKGRTGA